MDFHDGRLEFTDFSKTAGLLVERMRRFRPNVVLTFGTDGGLNTHPDHMVVSMLTTAAFHWSGQAKRYTEAGCSASAGSAVLPVDEFLFGGAAEDSHAYAVDGDAGRSVGAGAKGRGFPATCLAGSADGGRRRLCSSGMGRRSFIRLWRPLSRRLLDCLRICSKGCRRKAIWMRLRQRRRWTRSLCSVCGWQRRRLESRTIRMRWLWLRLRTDGATQCADGAAEGAG